MLWLYGEKSPLLSLDGVLKDQGHTGRKDQTGVEHRDGYITIGLSINQIVYTHAYYYYSFNIW